MLHTDITGKKQINFRDLDEFNEFLELVMRHHNYIISQFDDDPPYSPSIHLDFEDKYTVTEWARGFVIGIQMRPKIWSRFTQDEGQSDYLRNIKALAFEHCDSKVEWFDQPLTTPEERKAYFLEAVDNVNYIYRHFYPQRQKYEKARMEHSTEVRLEPKVGRNFSCPCGSGKKYKKCCGDPARLH